MARSAATFLLGCFLRSAGASTDEVAQFQTVASNFSPEISFDPGVPAFFQWQWSDGNWSTNWPETTVDFGSPASRLQVLTLAPPEAITSINLGFDGSDGGWTNYFTARSNQQVAAVSFLRPLPNLRFWSSSYNPITNTLDFSGFTRLEDVECFDCTSLQHVLVKNLPSIRRFCFENCFLQELDISNDPSLEDVRAALNAFTSVTIGGGTGPRIWHWCFRDNPQITQRFQPIMTNFFSLQELWVWNANQSGALTFVSTNLTDVEVHHNAYASADFTGQTNLGILQINDNQLTNLVLTGCSALELLEAQNNRLTTAALDRILETLDNPAFAIQTINLTGNSEFPSANGYAHYANLRDRPVYVTLDWPETNSPKRISVKVQSSPAGRTMTVDGKTYAGGQTFSWVPGSSHSVSTIASQSDSAGRRYEWTGWTDGGDIAHFVAPKSNSTYTARFSNPFTPLAGTYSGLFFEANGIQQETSGSVTLTLTDRAAFTGSINLAGKRYPLTGRFDLNGLATVMFSRNGDPTTVSLVLDVTAGTGHISGTVGNGSWPAVLQAIKAGFDSKLNPATDLAGSYTLVLPGGSADSGLPQGHGFGTLRVDSGGKLRISGVLGDASVFTYSVPISVTGKWPLYLSLYGGRGSLLGWMSFTNETIDDLSGNLSWIKPASSATKLFPAGFTNSAQESLGSRYTPPLASNLVLSLTNGAVTFNGGNLDASFSDPITLGANNKIVNAGTNKLLITIALPAGSFSGAATPPGKTKSLAFKGVLFQKQNAAYGNFSGTNQTGGVVLAP